MSSLLRDVLFDELARLRLDDALRVGDAGPRDHVRRDASPLDLGLA